MVVSVQEVASRRLDAIYRYTRERWGVELADRYLTEQFAAFDKIEVHGVSSQSIPAESTIDSFYYWQ
jgi:toxin ParE1/3/4